MDVLLPEALCLIIMDLFSVSKSEVFVIGSFIGVNHLLFTRLEVLCILMCVRISVFYKMSLQQQVSSAL